jgi:hypothetical protein
MTEVPSSVVLPPVQQTQPSGVVGNPSAGSTGFQANIGSGPTTGPQAQNVNLANRAGSLQLWSNYDISGSTLFPNYFPQETTREQLNQFVNGMRADEKIRLKRQLWSAGFYSATRNRLLTVDQTTRTATGLESDSSPQWTDKDNDALNKALTLYDEDSGTRSSPISFSAFVANEQKKTAANTQVDIASTFGTGNLSETLQTWFMEIAGRRLEDEEVNQLLNATFNTDMPEGNISTRMQYALGGGPTSSSLNIANSLADMYQLTVTAGFTDNPETVGGASEEFYDAFKDGRAVKISGEDAKLLRFHEWARTQQGPLFENVRAVYENGGSNPTGVIISFKDGAAIPDFAGANFSNADTPSQVQRFMSAIRQPGSWEAYADWGTQPNRRGAYGLSDQIWAFYTEQLGVDQADRTPNAQDRVAAAYIRDLAMKYHNNWEDMAYAIRLSEEEADTRIADRISQGAGYVDNLTMDKMWAKQAVDKMGNWRALYDPSNLKNTYEAKFGGGLAGDINPFAGMPKTEDEAMAKLKNNMWKLKGYEIANTEFMSKLIKDMNITSFAPGQEPWNEGA